MPQTSDQQRLYREAVRHYACQTFRIFFNHVFLPAVEAVEGRGVPGRHFDAWSDRMQTNPFTSTVSARKHAKSHEFYAWVMWRLFRMLYAENEPRFLEGLYLSFNDDMAQYHTKKIKRYIAASPWFAPLRALTDAESILRYATPTGRIFEMEPAGMFTFNRGRHPDFVLADDVLRDPEVRMDLSQIQKISKLFMDVVVSMPKEQIGELHVTGTPQDKEDLFFELHKLKRFNCREYPAIVNEATEEVLWPEMFPFRRLVEIRDEELGKKAFAKEFMCRPVRDVSGYFEDDEIKLVVVPSLKPWDGTRPETPGIYFGGMDLGKRQHPSHLSIFRADGFEDEMRLVQILSKWFDKTDYTEQVEYLAFADDILGLSGLIYDNTRAELEGFAEQKKLPPAATGEAMTAKMKHGSAALFARHVRKKTIQLLDDPRQTRQILSVDDNLDAITTREGHGDAFWSNALAVRAADLTQRPKIQVISVTAEKDEED